MVETAFVSVSERFIAAVYADHSGDAAATRRAIDLLAGEHPNAVAIEIARLLEQQVSYTWNQGWQPADLQRAAERVLTGTAPRSSAAW